ncbi:MAG: RidA family protein [Reinekea forsetii]|jgi:enamine deaminase RidA (YjgF/YER057c/UK114 family)|uniref:RidA family protein n=1 Tax=Reinekea TaxID=230494 RepID=UPI002357DBA5|nr:MULTISPECIES: RidA family protein [Reinekea]MDB9894876.1 RidA family protein [Reinekea forsetii]MDO7642780.1 RidA family protein [Reinekea forsetii]MDO7644296.1 RidA family protein [Reinekea forsetii]MDO7672859.1 RidA family protein [Reinekea forsetii]|tara:strand:- start:1438 stop:1788 length:351 start_codon:yes stop_codon:yes gene_type:complete
MTIQRINPSARWSDITVFNGVAYFVDVADDASADMTGQMQQLLAQAEQTLAKVGSDKSQLISVTIYITDFANVGALNDVWSAWLPADSAPSRACLKVELANPAYLVEIAFVAAVAD